MGRVPCPGDKFEPQAGSLASFSWSKNVAGQRAKEQDADLRDFYLHNLSDFQSYHFVYLDESGCNKRNVFRRAG